MGTAIGYSTKATTKSKQKKLVKTSCQMSKTYTIIGTPMRPFTKSKEKIRKKSEKKASPVGETRCVYLQKRRFFCKTKTCKKKEHAPSAHTRTRQRECPGEAKSEFLIAIIHFLHSVLAPETPTVSVTRSPCSDRLSFTGSVGGR